jgi:hypothetical protein
MEARTVGDWRVMTSLQLSGEGETIKNLIGE